MKKEYVKPTATKVQFLYREQVVAVSGDKEGNMKASSIDGSICHWGVFPCYDHA